MIYFKKISFLCYNEKEWEDAQDEFFRLGYEWESLGKNHIYCGYKFPRAIQNFRTDDIFGGKYLIMIDYCTHLKWNSVDKLTNLIDFNKYMRKKKLAKLSKIKKYK